MKLKLLTLLSFVSIASGCGKDDSDDSADAAAKSTMTVKASASLGLHLGVDTAIAKMTAYEFLVSKNPDCTDTVSLFSDDAGIEVDMVQGPEIGSGELEQGTYECLIMVMSDTITFTPSETTGNCTAATEYELDVFRPQGETYRPKGVLPDGTEITGEVGPQKFAVYISTLSTETGGGENANPMAAPTSSKTTNGIKLASALKVTGDTVGTMIMDTTGKVESKDEGNCDMQPPGFAFE